MTTTRAIGVTVAAVAASGFVLRRLIRSSRAIDFMGKSVLIVGGSRGLGLVIARELAAEGARLALAARDGDELDRARADLAERGFNATTIVCDIRERAQAEEERLLFRPRKSGLSGFRKGRVPLAQAKASLESRDHRIHDVRKSADTPLRADSPQMPEVRA